MAATDARLWAADANEALHLSLGTFLPPAPTRRATNLPPVRATADQATLDQREHYEGFNPCFTYPLFGEDEKIYGYRDLRIDVG